MRTKVASVVLSSLLFAQGLLGLTALVVVLTKETPTSHQPVRAAAVEGVVSVR